MDLDPSNNTFKFHSEGGNTLSATFNQGNIMAYTLLVWELVPEEIKMYLIPNEVANTYRDFLDDAHGKIINHHKETDGLRFLDNALSNEKTDAQNGWDDGDFNQYRGIFLKYEVKMGSPIRDTHITAVYHSGFAL